MQDVDMKQLVYEVLSNVSCDMRIVQDNLSQNFHNLTKTVEFM